MSRLFHVSNDYLTADTVLNTRYGNVIRDYRWFAYNDHNYAQYLKEMIFEDFRRSSHPEAPSRLASIYLFDDLNAAKKYKEKGKKGYIFEVETLDESRLLRADMRWMDLANRKPVNELLGMADSYFNSEATNLAEWEILCDQQVKIVKQTG